ncbi:hypothetical protein DFP93_13320 [Aneurinibacillus soli]|uniref:Uncharacterized protein n=1 Tax=Aneurinibacillus soli TaxID=1500254 RepID=A0A0U5AVM9_9BACL|nr:hypothetical protein [Aneurinibacillus soli]PYE57160.1 hypothetical protein DFP93_13320 [Aneurinibacillus soli]BAU25984.1 hypothetical protein CB4_00044 [Aneurinibacillus soli]
MNDFGFIFEGRNFASFDEMAETLFHEANERIVRMDIGEIQNTQEERAYIKWRLVHMQACFQKEIPDRYRSIYNSLWSQLYRLEHEVNYRHPYAVYLLERVFAKTDKRVR